MKAPMNTIFVPAHNRLSIRDAFQCDPSVIKNEVHHDKRIHEMMFVDSKVLSSGHCHRITVHYSELSSVESR